MTEEKEPLRIYTDGSCTNNGQPGACSGWGVHYQGQAHKDVFGVTTSTHHSNNSAEAQAVLIAILTAPTDQPVEIYSDSKYVVNIINNYIHKWKKLPFEELIKKPNARILLAIERAISVSPNVSLFKCKGHDKFNGDIAHDRLVDGNNHAHDLAGMGRQLEQRRRDQFNQTTDKPKKNKRKKREFVWDDIIHAPTRAEEYMNLLDHKKDTKS